MGFGLVEAGLCVLLQFVGLGGQFGEVVVVGEVGAVVAEHQEEVGLQVDQFLLGEVDFELALVVALDVEAALVGFGLVGGEGGFGGSADAAHQI